MRRQVSFNPCDQLWNADRLGQKWMSLDLQARYCLSVCNESRQKDNRCSVQCRIGSNPRGDFAAIRFRHRNIEQDKVRFKALRCLMSFARVVLFADTVAACSLEREVWPSG